MVLLIALPKDYPIILIGLTSNFLLNTILVLSIAFPARKKVLTMGPL